MEKLIYIMHIPNEDCNQPKQFSEVEVTASKDYPNSYIIKGYEYANNGRVQAFDMHMFRKPVFDKLVFDLAVSALATPEERPDKWMNIFTLNAKF